MTAILSMENLSPDYGLFYEFIENFSKDGFNSISRDHPTESHIYKQAKYPDDWSSTGGTADIKLLDYLCTEENFYEASLR